MRLFGSVDAGRHGWFVAGGAALALLAGYVNVVLLGFFHVPVSHMTGAVSRLGADLATRDATDLAIVAAMIAGFLLGCATSGLIIGSEDLGPGRRYGIALMVEGALLAASCLLALGGHRLAVPLAATACGVQNAMATSYHGLVLRTTHVTGIVTDIGLLLGHAIRNRRAEGWRIAMLTALLAGFLAGAVAGAFAHGEIGIAALWPASATATLSGALYFLHRHRVRRPRDTRN